jgi:hypothetical protein
MADSSLRDQFALATYNALLTALASQEGYAHETPNFLSVVKALGEMAYEAADVVLAGKEANHG